MHGIACAKRYEVLPGYWERHGFAIGFVAVTGFVVLHQEPTRGLRSQNSGVLGEDVRLV